MDNNERVCTYYHMLYQQHSQSSDCLAKVTLYMLNTRHKECSQNLRTAYLRYIHYKHISENACVPQLSVRSYEQCTEQVLCKHLGYDMHTSIAKIKHHATSDLPQLGGAGVTWKTKWSLA